MKVVAMLLMLVGLCSCVNRGPVATTETGISNACKLSLHIRDTLIYGSLNHLDNLVWYTTQTAVAIRNNPPPRVSKGEKIA